MYAPWGYIGDRITGHNVAKNGFHCGRIITGLVFDNWYSGIPSLMWPQIYEVFDPTIDRNAPQERSLYRAAVLGFGEIKIFKDKCPESRYDQVWDGPGAIDLTGM